MFTSRIVEEEIEIKTLFERFNVPEIELATLQLPYKINVETSKGWHKIENIFRTEKHQPLRVYFKNNKSIKCSKEHRFMTKRGWIFAKDLQSDDLIQTKTSFTGIKQIKHLTKEEILYDISVNEVHEYYSNGVISHNSWILQSIGANALKAGYNVAHYTLELNESYTALRYDSLITGISLDKLSLHQDIIKERLALIEGKLIIKYFPTKSISLLGLSSHLNKLKSLGQLPDIVIVDYADLLRFENNTMAKHDMLEALYEGLRGIAGEYQVPIWTASQSNKEGAQSDVLEGTSAAGAYAKMFPADFVMSLSRLTKDKLSNTARMFVIKNRFGFDGIVLPVHMDTYKGFIQVHEAISDEGEKLNKSMQTDKDYDKQLLRKKMRQFSESPETTSSNSGLF